jgi:DNA integrity scanning protein DisA with diadenylate cyclase activity
MNGDKGLGSCRKGRHIASSHDLAVLEGTHEVAEISKTLEERPRREPNWQRNIFDNISTASKRESFRKARAVITIENQRKSQSSSPYSPNIF